ASKSVMLVHHTRRAGRRRQTGDRRKEFSSSRLRSPVSRLSQFPAEESNPVRQLRSLSCLSITPAGQAGGGRPETGGRNFLPPASGLPSPASLSTPPRNRTPSDRFEVCHACPSHPQGRPEAADRRPEEGIFFLPPPVSCLPPLSVPRRGIEPRPTDSKSVMLVHHTRRA